MADIRQRRILSSPRQHDRRELNDLVKAIEKFRRAPPRHGLAPWWRPAARLPAAEEKTEFNLGRAGSRRPQKIGHQAVREMTGLGLKGGQGSWSTARRRPSGSDVPGRRRSGQEEARQEAGAKAELKTVQLPVPGEALQAPWRFSRNTAESGPRERLSVSSDPTAEDAFGSGCAQRWSANDW